MKANSHSDIISDLSVGRVLKRNFKYKKADDLSPAFIVLYYLPYC